MPTVDRSLFHLYPEFSEHVKLILAEMNGWCVKHWPGHTAAVAEGFRTTERQQELYAQGRSKPGSIVTHKNGTTNPSNHQTGLAVDVVGYGTEGFTWSCPPEFWVYLGHCARSHGLEWGGDWESFKDLPHIEHPSHDYKTYQAARDWKKHRGLD